MTNRFFSAILVLGLLLAVPARGQVPTVPQSRAQMELSFAPLVKQTAPAVVNIYTKRTVLQRGAPPFGGNPFFAPFFQDDFFGGRMRKQVENTLGSGVIVEPGGLVVTNAHVVRGAEEIRVVLADGREFGATLSLKDDASDLAILRIETDKPLPSIPLKPSETLEVGDLVLAIGNPFGVGQTVTSGIVSAKGRSSLDINDFNFFIQTDAAINPGNSGGALVALDGGLVGVNTAIYSRSGGSLGIGFAIPSEMVASVIAAEKAGQGGANSGVIRPWLGVTTQNITADIAESLGLDTPHGALIANLHAASPLKKAGAQVGDVILAADGRTIKDGAELKFRMATVPLGQKADFEISRKSKRLHVSVEAVVPPDSPPRDRTTLEGAHALNGVVIANINPAVEVELGMEEDGQGVAILEVPRGTYAQRFLTKGDVLMKINDTEIKTVKDAVKALEKGAPQGLSLVVKSRGRLQQITIR